MRTWLTTTALALVLAAPAAGQTQTDTQVQDPAPLTQAQTEGQAPSADQAQAEQTQGDPDALYVTAMIGMPVYAPPEAQQGAAGTDGFAISAAELADYATIGWVSDVVLGRDGAPRGVVVALGDMTTTDAAAGGMVQEVMIETDRIRFLADDTVETLNFAVLDIPLEEVSAAPPVDRFAAAGAMTGGMAGGMAGDPAMGPGAMGDPAMGQSAWRMDRAPMAAPGMAIDGYTPVPVGEISVDTLVGAQVYGEDSMNIGSVGDVMMDASGGAVEYLVIDVGGFLGIGSREVAIGLDEVTVLRDAGWDDLQVHVAATQDTIEALPEFQREAN